MSAPKPSCWDFYVILDIIPEDKFCVGETKQGCRCGNVINKADRYTANLLITQMNQKKELLKMKGDVEQLAELMLCKHVHNSDRYSDYNQVKKMSSRWTEMIDVKYGEIQKKNKDAAAMKAKKETRRVERIGERRAKVFGLFF